MITEIRVSVKTLLKVSRFYLPAYSKFLWVILSKMMKCKH